MTSSRQIALGLGMGVGSGLFLGELASGLSVVASGYVRLLQMTVLPYVTISLILGLGQLTPVQARALFTRVGGLLLAMWVMALILVFAMPLAFPAWESASFYSSALIDQPEEVDFLSLYIPANPFFSLANSLVPAVVVFSALLGVALMGVDDKQRLLGMLEVASHAIRRAAHFVIQLTPFGVFAIAAHTAGTMSVEELGRLQVFFVSYIAIALLTTFWILPALVDALTPIPYRDVIGQTKDALLTAFVTGEVFVVLPMLAETTEQMLQRIESSPGGDRSLAAVIVPAAFSFPHTGKILTLSFILFAGWYADAAVPLHQYPSLATTGLVSMFGSVTVAVPFLLDLFRIPADLFQLFLATSVINQRFGALVAAMHTVALALLGTCAISGTLRLRASRLLRYGAVTTVLALGTISGVRLLLATTVENQYERDEVIASMQLLRESRPGTVVHRQPPSQRLSLPDAGRSQLDAILDRGVLRVGYSSDSLPYAYFNTAGDLVGLDVEMAHRLAEDLEVRLELVPLFPRDADDFLRRLDGSYCDLVMSGVGVTVERARAIVFSEPYLDETIAFIVKDHLRAQYASFAEAARHQPRLAVPNIPFVGSLVRSRLPQAEITEITSPTEFFESIGEHVDGAVMTAERGSAWTLLFPQYSVVVPEGDILSVPLAYPIAGGDTRLARFVNDWLQLKRRDGTIASLVDYWILGQNAAPPAPRWSIIRDVLHWVE